MKKAAFWGSTQIQDELIPLHNKHTLSLYIPKWRSCSTKEPKQEDISWRKTVVGPHCTPIWIWLDVHGRAVEHVHFSIELAYKSILHKLNFEGKLPGWGTWWLDKFSDFHVPSVVWFCLWELELLLLLVVPPRPRIHTHVDTAHIYPQGHPGVHSVWMIIFQSLLQFDKYCISPQNQSVICYQ